MQKKEGFLLCSAPEKALSKWDMVYEIVAVIFSAAVVLIDFPPILIHMLLIFLNPWQRKSLLLRPYCDSLGLYMTKCLWNVFF